MVNLGSVAAATTLLLCALFPHGNGHTGQENTKSYSNEWVVRLEGGPQVAELVALQFGYRVIGEVKGFNNTYGMLKENYPVHKKRGNSSLTEILNSDSRVQWAEQQFSKRRQKRDYQFHFLAPYRMYRNNSSWRKSAGYKIFNDELWDQQWYMHDTRTRDDLPKLDLNVLPCYEMGITGKGVRVTIIDDGLEHTHYDLRDNYDPEISYDVNDDDPDPSPRYDSAFSNAHGTRCAGEVAMKANNGKCGVGIAYNARIGCVKLLDGKVKDKDEGIALGYAHDKVDIYSVSWGPRDDGKTLEGPGRLALEAIERGIREGRNGLGVIYVWAAGNGGAQGDNCECDGYTNSIYTLSINGVSQNGRFPPYGEKCASTLAVTHAGGAYSDQMIVSTDLMNRCTVAHSGTSASAPLAAGIVALVLEMNPNLTWRDMQHLAMWTAEYEPLKDNQGWIRNGAGHWVNTRFGFGLMNAYSMVKSAANWTNVPEKYTCSVEADRRDLEISFGMDVQLHFDGSECTHINYLEHVELQINIEYPVRGDLEIHLLSASGTEIQLLNSRKRDKSKRGFRNWKLMSVLTWNENPQGLWSVLVSDKVGSSQSGGRIGKFVLHFHGLKEKPGYLKEADLSQEESESEESEGDWWTNMIESARSLLGRPRNIQ